MYNRIVIIVKIDFFFFFFPFLIVVLWKLYNFQNIKPPISVKLTFFLINLHYFLFTKFFTCIFPLFLIRTFNYSGRYRLRKFWHVVFCVKLFVLYSTNVAIQSIALASGDRGRGPRHPRVASNVFRLGHCLWSRSTWRRRRSSTRKRKRSKQQQQQQQVSI